MKRTIVAGLLVISACQTTAPAPPMKQPMANQLPIAPDTPQGLAQLPRTTIDYDHSLLNDNERQVVAKLVDASKQIDEIFLRQVSEENPDLRTRLQQQAGASALNRAAYDYFIMNKGPWDRLKQDEPFVDMKKKPAGAAFYPEDITKEELEKYIAANPDTKDELQGLFTVVRRESAVAYWR